MITNKKAYYVRNETRNNTNTKKYNLLNNNFIVEATFRFTPNKEIIQNEYCVIARAGYNMGIFTQSNDAIKWCWWEVDDVGNHTYHDIFIFPINNNLKHKLKVIKHNDTFTLYLNDELYVTATYFV